MSDRIRWVRIQGLRSIEDLRLDVGGLQVLIGENGAGKSSIVEAFEILRKTSADTVFVRNFVETHGLLSDLITPGARELRLTVRVEGDEPSLEYTLALGPVAQSQAPVIAEERLDVVEADGTVVLTIFERSRNRARALLSESDDLRRMSGPDRFFRDINPSGDALALTYFGGLGPSEAQRIRTALSAISVHTPFDTRPRWAQDEGRAPGRSPSLRMPSAAEPANLLRVGGSNLASAIHALKNLGGGEWNAVLLDVRAGLGSDVVDVVTPSRQPGFIELGLRFEGFASPVPASQLSDGQLSFLATVALKHLPIRPSVLLFDEPELHLHPGLLVRSTWHFEEMSERYPVILSTHSDALLDALTDPVESVRILELGDRRRTGVSKVSRDRLDAWRGTYSTLGSIRREGLLPAVADGDGVVR